MIDQAVIDRVDRIHEALGEWARRVDAQSLGYYSVASIKDVSWTADEVRRWPELKAAMVKGLTDGDAAFVMWRDWIPGINIGRYTVAQNHNNAKRGLCMARESRAFKEHMEQQRRSFRKRLSERTLPTVKAPLSRTEQARLDPTCACGASLVTNKAFGMRDNICGECWQKRRVEAGMNDDEDMALTRPPAFPDVSRPVVSLAEQAHPLGHFSGRRRRYL
jgi:hypothetical protein